MESQAVQILQTRLEAEGGSAPITSLSVKVKWGQHELQGFGHIRKFLSKHDEFFTLEGSSVLLVKAAKRAVTEELSSKKTPRIDEKRTLIATPKVKADAPAPWHTQRAPRAPPRQDRHVGSI